MTEREFGEEMLPILRQLRAVLETVADPIQQQASIELLLAWHAMRMGDAFTACKVVDGVCKHAKQFITNNIAMLMDGEHRS
jgi:hypothetical protein